MTKYIDLYQAPLDTSPAITGYTISPSDTTDQDTPFRSLYIGVGGDVVVVGLDGATVLYHAVPQGTILPVKGKRVAATNTTASYMVGMV
jgi:hypothetical protein